VESKFRVGGISSEAERFDLVVGSLPKESLRQVIDVLENPDAATPYTTLKGRLLSAHEPTTFQRIEMLHKMEPLGGRKPSELMAHMLELCPRGQEKNEFFLFLFLQRLPRELRVLLGDDFAEPWDLAARADRLWAMHSHDHALIATLQGEEPSVAPVAAVQSGGQRPQAARGGAPPSGPEAAVDRAAVAVAVSGRRLLRPLPTRRELWPGSPQASATSTGPTATRRPSVRVLAVGETDCPGPCQRRRPRVPSLPSRRHLPQAFFSRYWCQFFNFSVCGY
jgi:hypothetical protein